ncbi:Endonuclease MutS2 [Galdieria sulphuraria]|nr:Endonuclease MutS2 [Galdieria sulphuraria]
MGMTSCDACCPSCVCHYYYFVSLQIIQLKSCRCYCNNRIYICVHSRLARKCCLQNKLGFQSQLRSQPVRKGPYCSVLSELIQQKGSQQETYDEVFTSYREQLEHETLKALDWFPICEKVADFCQTDRVRLFVANGMKVNHWSKEQTQQYLMETNECIRFMESGYSPTDWMVGANLLENIVDRAQKGSLLTPRELYQIVSTTLAISNWKQSLQSQSTNYPLLYRIVENVVSMKDLEDSICRSVDEKEQIRDNASIRLYETRTQIRSTFEHIRKVLHSLLQQHEESLQEPIYTERFGRYVIPVKATRRNRVPGIIQDISSSGSTLYIEPNSIRSLTNRMQQLRHIEEEAIEEILFDLSRKVCENADHLLYISHAIFQLDWILARAQFSQQINGRFPTIVESFSNAALSCKVDAWKLRGVRHPLLERNSIVPIDFEVRPGVTAVCITGPNTGGKTVALKTFGIVILMTKVGLFVPCEQNDVHIPFFEDIFADVGDHQSVTQSLSTFSSHILRIQRIVQLSHKRSLVLLDEIGTGTDPVEGCALAMSLLLYLVERVGFLMATTHHGELKTLKYKDARFENASVELDTFSLRPTYRLIWGVAGRSSAIAIAQRLGLDNWITQSARSIVENGVDKLSLAIEDIERTKQQVIEMKEQIERKERELECLERQLMEREERIQQLENEWIETKKQALEQDFANAREQIAKVIKEVQRCGSDASLIMERKQELESLMLEQKSASHHDSVSGTKVRKGDWVLVKRLSSEPLQVVEGMNNKGDVMVRFGSIRVKVSIMEAEVVNDPTIQKVENRSKLSKKRSTNSTLVSSTSSSIRAKWNTIDVRGCRVEEAAAKIENELGRNAECNQYFIIHGFGPLRTGLRHYFYRHPLIRQMNDADTENGGQGVTILHLHMG